MVYYIDLKYRISSAIRQSFFSFQNNPKNLDPSYKMDLDLWDCLGLSLPRKSVVRLTDRPDMTLDVYRGRKTTMQQQQQIKSSRCYLVQSFMALALISIEKQSLTRKMILKELT